MKRYVIGIASFLIIWNIFYRIFLIIDFPNLVGFPILLIAFAIILVLAQKCVDYFLQDQNEKLAMGYLLIIVGLMIGIMCQQVLKFTPKGFEDLLGCKIEKIKKIEYTYVQEEYGVIDDMNEINELLKYLDSFTYSRKKEQETSSNNLQQNRYGLGFMYFIKENGKRVFMNFYGPELLVGTTFYKVEEGAIEEKVLLELLDYENK